MPPQNRRSRARRVLGVIGAVVGTTVTFVTATAAAAVLHLDAPVTRRLVATQVNAVLRDQFAGSVAIERIGSLGLRGVSGVRVRVKDQEGVQVIYVDGARVRVHALDIARSFLFGKGDIVIGVDAASLDYVDAAIDGDPAGNLRIANAFQSKKPPSPPDPNARGFRVDAPDLAVRRAWIHGQAPGAPPLDAELRDLAAHAHVDPKVTRADLDRVDLVTRGLPRGVDPRGRVAAHVSMPSATGKETGLEATFDGAIAGIPTSAQAKMDGQKIDAVVDGHDVRGQGMRATFGEVGIQDEVTLHAEAHGELPRIGAKANVTLGRGSVDVDGKVDLSDGTKAEATVAVRHIDAHAILPSAPVSDVGLDTRANVAIAKSGEVAGDFVLETVPGKVAGETLPILKAHGEFTKDTAHAVGNIQDPRATADFEANLTTAGEDKIVEGRIGATVLDLSRMPKVGKAVKGHVVVDAQGKANLGKKTFDARAHAVGGDFAYDGQKVDNMTLLATANGTLDRPTIEVGVHTGGLASGENKIGSADIRGRVEPGAATTIRDAHVDMVKEGRTITVTAERVEVGGPRMSVDGAVVTGLGAPVNGSFSKDARGIRVKLDAPDVDLAVVAQVAGRPKAVRNGHLAMNGDVTLERNGATGEMHANVTQLSASAVDGGRLDLDASFADKSIGLHVKAELADTGHFELATNDIVLAGSPIEASSWKRAQGKAKFDANVDMGRIATIVPKEQLPVSELKGRLTVVGTLRRDSGDVPPEMSVHAHTRGLVVAGKTSLERAHDVPHEQSVSGVQPWRSEGVDGSVDARIDATSGYGELAVHVVDRNGTLVAMDAKSDLPYQQMLAEPGRVVELLENAPLSAKLVVPKRALANMPEAMGTKTMPGTVEAELILTGTALDPRVELIGHARGVRSPALPAKMSTDADVDFKYDGTKGDLVAKVNAEKHEAVSMTAHVDLKARDLVQPTPGQPLAWGGSARVKLASFPLETINAVADRKIRGHVSGELAIDDLHDDARLRAQIGLDGLKIGRAKYEKGNIVVTAENGKLDATARLEQTDGYADLHASAGLVWGAQVVPTLDTREPVEAHLDAQAFRAAAVLPFVQSTLNELDGRVDANATIKLGDGLKEPTLDGKLAFHDGTLQFVAFGEEFKDARANVTFERGGLIKVDDVYMRATDGEVSAAGRIQTRGLGLGSATASVSIPARHALAVSLQGQPYGEVSGNVKVAAVNSQDGKTLDVKVDVPAMKVELPQKMKSGVQDLSEKENIRIGVFRDPKTFVKLPLDKEDIEPPKEAKPVSTVTNVSVALGDITIIQGNQARVVLGGNPHIRITNETQVTGQIQLKEGKIDVQGKKFEIEKGTVTFQPDDPSNPIVVATAGWTAEDGSKIYADFVGPVKTGKVNLRSDPPRPKNEILAMVLFGTADGANAKPPPPGRAPDGTTKAATTLGGGFAAQGLTEAMDDLTGVQATARIDTTRSSNPAPEIEIQLARRISLAFEHVLGTPPISEPDTNLAIVDWRFRKNWSLETTVGDRGKVAADAIWTKRY